MELKNSCHSGMLQLLSRVQGITQTDVKVNKSACHQDSNYSYVHYVTLKCENKQLSGTSEKFLGKCM